MQTLAPTLYENVRYRVCVTLARKYVSLARDRAAEIKGEQRRRRRGSQFDGMSAEVQINTDTRDESIRDIRLRRLPSLQHFRDVGVSRVVILRARVVDCLCERR